MNNVLVTHAAGDLGTALAQGLAADGWPMVLHHDGHEDGVEKLAADIRKQGGQAICVEADLASEDAVRSLIPAIVEESGPLACLINNASSFAEDTVATASRQSLDANIQVNMRTPFVLCQCFSAQLAAGQLGNVVNVIDPRMWNSGPHFLSDTLGKQGLWSLTQSLALALAPDIRVNAVGPAAAGLGSKKNEAALIEQWSSAPMRRISDLQEIVETVRFILDTPSMTGQIIALDCDQDQAMGGV